MKRSNILLQTFSIRAERFLPGLRLAYLSLILFLLVNLGGVDPYSQNVAAIGVSILTVLTLPLFPAAGPLRRLWITGAGVLLSLAGIAIFQSVRFSTPLWEHEAWALARTQLGWVNGAISVSPEQTRAALVSLAPFAGFLVMLLALPTKESAFLLLRRCVYLGAFVALFGILHLLFFSTSEDFRVRSSQVGSLTGFFINRNSAGTFLGSGLLLATGLSLFYLRSLSPGRFSLDRLTDNSRDSRGWRQVGAFAGLAMLQGLALLLTQSRGALLSTSVALIILMGLHYQAGPLYAGTKPTLDTIKRRLTPSKLALMILVLLFILWMLGERTLYRFDAHGVDEARLCVFRSTWKAFLEHWQLGTGFGVFVDSFPPYRESQCAGVAGIWESAHNSFLEGMLGFGVAFPLLVGVAMIMLVRTYRSGLAHRRRYSFAPIAGLAVLIQISLHSMLDFSMHIPAIGFYVAALLAATATISLEREEAE